MRRAVVPVVLAVLLLLGQAPPARAEWTLAAYLGAAHTASSDLAVRQPGVLTDLRLANVDWASRSSQPPLYYGCRAGYFLRSRPFLGLELELIHLKAYAQTGRSVAASGLWHNAPVDGVQPLGDFVPEFGMSHGANFWLANVVLRVPLGGAPAGGTAGRAARLHALLRLGAGPTLLHPESTIEDQHREGYEWGGLGLQAAAGIEVRAWRGLRVFGEGKLTRTEVAVEIAAGDARTTLLGLHVVGGAGWAF